MISSLDFKQIKLILVKLFTTSGNDEEATNRTPARLTPDLNPQTPDNAGEI